MRFSCFNFITKQGSMQAVGGFTPMSPRISSPAHPSGGGGGERGRGRGGGGMGRGGISRRDRELIGQTVRIVRGPFKGKYLYFRSSLVCAVIVDSTHGLRPAMLSCCISLKCLYFFISVILD